MFSKKRLYVISVIAVFLSAALGFASSGSVLDSRKEDVLRKILRDLGYTEDQDAFFKASRRAASLMDVRIHENPTQSRVALTISGKVLYDFEPCNDSSTRWKIELYNTLSLYPERSLSVSQGGLLKDVSVKVYALQPLFVTRVYFETRDPAVLQASCTTQGLEIALRSVQPAEGPLNPVVVTATKLRDELDRGLRLLDIEATKQTEYVLREVDRKDAQFGSTDKADAEKSVQRSLAEALAPIQSLKDGLAAQKAELLDILARVKSNGTVNSELEKRINALREIANKEESVRQERLAAVASKCQEIIASINAITEVASVQDEAGSSTSQLADAGLFTGAKQQDSLRLIANNLTPQGLRPDKQNDSRAENVTAVFTPVPLADLNVTTSMYPQFAATEEPAQSSQSPASAETASPESPGAESAPAPQETPSPPAAPTVLPSVPPASKEKSVVASPTGTFLPRGGDVNLNASPFVQSGTEKEYHGDPLYRPVTLDFRQMELTNAVALLAQAAQINVIAGTDVTVAGTVTAYLKDVPLLTAIETVLRMNDLGIVEEEGIFRIVPYEQAVAAKRVTRMVHLERGDIKEIEKTLQSIGQSYPPGEQVTVTSSQTTNTLLLSGPEKRIAQLEALARDLDVAKPVLPTITETIKLNYSEPEQLVSVVKGMLTPEGVGSVEADSRGRQLIVTDMPVVIEQVRKLVAQLDVPVKQVGIEAMIIDAVMRDNAQTGVNWLLDLVREHPSPQATLTPLRDRVNRRGNIIGTAHDLNTGVDFVTPGATAGNLAFGLLTDSFDLRGAISAEVLNRHAQILANPVVVTAENKAATIDITQEYPYTQLTQSTQGPPVASTAFKSIGITLEVTPRVTHNKEILVDIQTKQSSISGFSVDNVPIEEKRSAKTTLRTTDDRTIFIGGLRRADNTTDIRKVPVLGDVPVFSFLFRNNTINKINTELLVFLTCRVIDDALPPLTDEQQVEYERLDNTPREPNAQRDLFHSLVKPRDVGDPSLKWRRTQ